MLGGAPNAACGARSVRAPYARSRASSQDLHEGGAPQPGTGERDDGPLGEVFDDLA